MPPAELHKIIAMDLPEIRNAVFRYLTRRSLVRFMRINKAWHESAAALIWESLSLTAMQQMPSVEALRRYAYLVKTLQISSNINDQIVAECAALNFSKLQKLRLNLTAGNATHVYDLISRHSTLTSLDLSYHGTPWEPFFDDPHLGEAIASLPNLNTLHLQF
ncbi:hypothetical protein BC939DRAFT_531738 [Gamsiella multidivaricata]|uniref:uncharacterized protein n=1 Tax=Gamsiella multidivaricata TaxID=101098 RepID=UPI002221207D|nr:uncharacterized protein BC939DRAFT_531738 [Gamsiella multidivaricata]KAG0355391.1 hypothetical protein BGZ54_001176 [Gamsiella multidivaricata]KAI7818774.1 hypothetical protein BC939DRAFT_531738 [Gamsiella multidivaricata]